ncbi:sulfite exporter TauE/SafE family protein [Pseudoalteromonas haloplanktis]|uniref:Probable membrane transporter protein n=1 Tax=Pseudoalteromonas haloplanktis TaxID=228 RepID=A0ABU1BCA0_PSEHA|nr:sulfite exporter TauE/SafE family protein [Pseudoalteromonas haloplanktis]MDQ9092103.1 sulfite exporter TauE/SafE family protein [Pseudoalteromonas haloplanktis]
MTATTLAIIAFVVLLTGVSKSGFAGALGVFSVPILMLIMPPVAAIGLMLPVLIVADVFSLKSYWQQWDIKQLKRLLPGLLAGVITAHILIGWLDAAFIKTTIAILCIVFAIRSLAFSQFTLSALNSRLGALSMGGLAGITSTLIHAGGPPLIMYFSTIQLPPKRFVATVAIIFAMMNAIKLIGFISLGLIEVKWVLIALASLPIAFIGNRLGIWLQSKLNTAQFLKMMNFLLLLLGIWLLAK